MKQVRKNSDQIVEFDKEKIITSLLNNGFGNTRKLIQGLVKKIMECIEEMYPNSDVITTSEIREAVIKSLGDNGYFELKHLYENKETTDDVKPMITQQQQGEWSIPAQEVMKHRYLMRDANGNILEEPEEMFWRVAQNIAQAELNYDETVNTEDKAKEFYSMMINREFLPNSPTLMNAGRDLQMCVACFVIDVPDDMSGIMDATKAQALIQKAGGGTGMSFSDLRPKGDMVGSTQGASSGPVSFMQVFDAVTNTIKQGGKRRGANMGVLSVDHPDILDFIVCKLPSSDADFRPLENFNISVAITDEFMESVRHNLDFDLVNPRDGQVTASVKARDLFGKLVYSAWLTGDPGILFIDKINEDNFLPQLGDIKSTNPCVTGDTWVVTEQGPQQVSSIINRPINILCDGKFYGSSNGFFSSGVKKVYKIVTDSGYEIKATEDHPIFCMDDKGIVDKVEVKNLCVGDKIKLSNNRGIEWGGRGTSDEGYLLGLLVGDGTMTNGKAILSVWGNDEGNVSMRKHVEKIAQKMPHRSDFRGFNSVNRQNPNSKQLEYRMNLVSLTKLANEYGLSDDAKTITAEIENTSSDFHIGFLSGLFDADGSVMGMKKNGRTIRLSQVDILLLQAAQRMLLRLGVVSKLYKNRKKAQYKPWTYTLVDGTKKHRRYFSQATHELIISKDNMKIFYKIIQFRNIDKQNKLKDKLGSYILGPKDEEFVTKIIDIIPMDKEEVYDIQVEDVHRFDANGMIIANCGEQSLHSWDACNLGSINLERHLVEKDGVYEIDMKKLSNTVHKAVNFLDNVIDMSEFPIQKIADMVSANRRIGLGIMGWHDVLIRMEIPYSSDRAVRLAGKIMEFIAAQSRDASCELGGIRGNFPNYDESLIGDYFGDIPMRNSYVNTIAPTGTIGIIAGPISSGCEPYFSIAWRRRSMLTEGGVELMEVNPLFEEVAKREGFYSDRLLDKIIDQGTLEGIDEIPIKWQSVFAYASDIPYDWHIKMQAGFQRHIDNSISKTINMKSEASLDDVEKSFFLAWELGCKGLTIYRDGCRDNQVLNVKLNDDSNTQNVESSSLSSIIKSSGGCATCESV